MSSTIRRATKDADNPFCTVRRATFEDERLSWEARGLLAYLLVKPDDWIVNVTNLVNQSPGGRDRVYRILNELIDHNYIQRNEIRDSGKIVGYEYLVFEEPYAEKPEQMTLIPEAPDTEKPDTESPLPEKPDTVLPDTEKPDSSNKEVLLNTTLPLPAATAPPQTGGAKTKRPKESTPEEKLRRDGLRAAWQAATGAENYDKAQVNTGIKRLDVAGVTPEELAGCVQWMKLDTFWQDENISPQSIFKKLDAYRRYMQRAHNTNGNRPAATRPGGDDGVNLAQLLAQSGPKPY